jgi:hypothetical protein
MMRISSVAGGEKVRFVAGKGQVILGDFEETIGGP